MLDEAIKAIAEELRTEHGWSVCEDDAELTPDATFVRVLRKHIEPLLSEKAMIRARLVALDTERDLLTVRLHHAR